uniref:Adenine nucleotide alpha hydrolase family protein n=1 Tax=Fervidicoccus fontis TaxID=683846 RepID=A0A7J3ZMT4_9CREN
MYSVRCKYCGKRAVVSLRYAMLNLCGEHYLNYIISKVEKTIKRYRLVERSKRLLVAVSGGKDSSVLTHVLWSLKSKLDLEIVLFHLHLGLGEYSNKQERAVRELASLLAARPLIVVYAREILPGDGIPELALKVGRSTCSVCGAVKRYLMNVAAMAVRADAIATGHNTDDILAYFLKNLVFGGEEYSLKLTPRTEGLDGLAIARARPLYEVYERETLLYAILSKIPFVHEECPFRPERSIEEVNKDYLNRLEERAPGSKLRLARRFVSMVTGSESTIGEVLACRYCGMPSRSGVCTFCRLTSRVYGEPLGPKAVDIIKAKILESKT